MKQGSQSEIAKAFDVSRTAIYLLVKSKDERIKYTPDGKIDVLNTIVALKNGGFGKRASKIKSKKPPKATAKAKKPAKKANPTRAKPKDEGVTENDLKALVESEPDEDLADYISGKKSFETAPRHLISRFKELEQAKKEQIRNQKDLKELVNFNETAETVFNFLRPLRDDLQDAAKRVSAIGYKAESKRDLERVFNEEIDRILRSRLGPDFKLDDTLKKKIIEILRM